MNGRRDLPVHIAHHYSRFHNFSPTAHIGHAKTSEFLVKEFSLVFPHSTFRVDNTYERRDVSARKLKGKKVATQKRMMYLEENLYFASFAYLGIITELKEPVPRE